MVISFFNIKFYGDNLEKFYYFTIKNKLPYL